MIARAESTLDLSSSATSATSVGKTRARDDTYSSADGDNMISVVDDGAADGAPPFDSDAGDADTMRTCGGAR